MVHVVASGKTKSSKGPAWEELDAMSAYNNHLQSLFLLCAIACAFFTDQLFDSRTSPVDDYHFLVSHSGWIL